jgi:long-chain acyl-CoA synthetase
VYPTEVEKMLHEHAAISMVPVIGAADEKYGEETKAYVVLVPGARTSEDEIIAWAKNRIAAHKYPRRVEFVSSLPMSANGKILKRELRAREKDVAEPCGVRGRETAFSNSGAGAWSAL